MTNVLCCLITILLVWTTLISIIKCHGTHRKESPTKPKSEALLNLEQKWKPEDFVRDIDHVREDLQQVIELKDKGEISDEDMLFYMFRMHDFDDNQKLDGLEIMNVIVHAAPEINDNQADSNSSAIFTYVIDGVDSMLKLDMDNDGFLSYAEMKQQFAKMET